jgi:hypothetical protein
MSALSVDDTGDPQSHHYYAPRHRRVVAREATLQPVLERLRNGARSYSADERLDASVDLAALPEADIVVLPSRRLPIAAVAAFAGGATAVAAIAVAYLAFGANGAPIAQPQTPPVAAPAKIEARLARNQPVSQSPAAQPLQRAPAGGTGPSTDTTKSDRLDASADPAAGATYNPLQSPLSVWELSPTQAAIEGIAPALAATATPPSAQAADAAPPPQQPTTEQQAEHHRHVSHDSHVGHARHVRHVRHRRPATTGAAAGAASAAPAANDAATPPAAKKFLGLFGG